MDFRRKLILQDLQTMIEACKVILGRLSEDGRRPVPMELSTKIAEHVVAAARNGNYSRDEIIAAVAQEMTRLLPGPDASAGQRRPGEPQER